MRTMLTGIAVAGLVMATQPAWSQTNSQQLGQNTQQTTPGGGGASQTGVPGQPGNKSGPAAKPSNGAGMGSGTGAAGSDSSGVKGLPGNKSGPSTKEPGQNR